MHTHTQMGQGLQGVAGRHAGGGHGARIKAQRPVTGQRHARLSQCTGEVGGSQSPGLMVAGYGHDLCVRVCMSECMEGRKGGREGGREKQTDTQTQDNTRSGGDASPDQGRNIMCRRNALGVVIKDDAKLRRPVKLER